MQSVREAFETVHNPDHKHDTVTLDVQSPGEDFKLQYAAGGYPQTPLWNLCDDPPGGIPEGWVPISQMNVAAVVEANADTPGSAVAEAKDLIERVGGDEATIPEVETFTRAKHPGEYLERAVHAVRNAVSVVVG